MRKRTCYTYAFGTVWRMKLGRCLPTDTGYMGCQSNVLPHFDKECSGKEKCKTVVFDRFINAQGGCIKGLLSYLEVEYRCVKGTYLFNKIYSDYP